VRITREAEPTHLRIHLHRPLQNPLGPHIRRARTKHRPNPRRTQPHHQRIDRIRAHQHHAIPLPHPLGPQRSRHPAGTFSQLPEGRRPPLPSGAAARPALAHLSHRHARIVLVGRRLASARGRVAREEQVLGKVEADALEPARDGVDGQGLVDRAGVSARVQQVGGVEEGGPEGVAVCERPGVKVAEGLGVCVNGWLYE
jgi:hypothetical protein